MDKILYEVKEIEEDVLLIINKMGEDEEIISSTPAPILDIMPIIEKNILQDYLTSLENKIIELFSSIIYHDSMAVQVGKIMPLIRTRDSIKDYVSTLEKGEEVV